MDPVPQPHELRADYLARGKLQDEQRTLKRRRFVRRWIWISAFIGLAAAVINYLAVTYACIAHFLFSGAAGYVLLRYKRGHLSGMVLVGLGNLVIAIFGGPFNPFGPLGFALAGAFIGLGQRLEEDLQ